MEKITVLVVNYNSSAFIEASLYALNNLTKFSYKVLVADSANSSFEDTVKLKDICSLHENVELFKMKDKFLSGSMDHANSLDFLTKKVDTPYFAILDADATFLHKDWDEILIHSLSDTAPLIGTPPCGNKPKDFPLMFAILIRTKEFKDLDISFTPEKDRKDNKDTGREMREKYFAAGLEGITLEARNTRQYNNGPFARILGCVEYYHPSSDKIFASHFGRGSTLGANKYVSNNIINRILYSLPFIGKYLLKKKGLQDVQDWIAITKGIADQVTV